MAVVEQGGFSTAARALRISVSQVSRTVAGLEAHLGVRLLQRTTRKVTLTDAGRELFERGRALLDALDDLAVDVANRGDALRGTIRVSAGGAYGERYVAPALLEFAALHPNVAIELVMTDRRVDLIADGIDFAVRHGTLPDSSLVARRIGSRHMRLCAAPAYLDAQGTPSNLSDLAGHYCIASPNIEWRLASGGKEIIFKPKQLARFRSTSGPALVEAALAGFGIVWLADFYVRDHLAAGRLVRLLPDAEIDAIADWIVYPARDHVPTRVQAAMDHLALQLPV